MAERFSDRIKLTSPRTAVQIREMDEPLTNMLWNLLCEIFDKGTQSWTHLARQVAIWHLSRAVDALPVHSDEHAWQWLRQFWFSSKWWERYNLLEFVVANADGLTLSGWKPDELAGIANSVLERELAGYRFINGKLVEITSDQEVQAIEEALAAAGRSGLGGVHAHIATALAKLAMRPQPDCRNAIKEAVSAVESVAKVIARKEKATLDDALNAVAGVIPIHGALIEAFRKLYGFSSDEKGIRHALLGETAKVDVADARFFIVACSAFVNLVIVKADKAGLLKK